MTERDADGFRTDPNGDRFELTITTAEISPDFLGLAELLKVYFENVGIRTTIDLIGNDLFGQRMDANELMATIHWSDEPIWGPGISEDYWPDFKGNWAPMSARYFTTNGEVGREPPAYLARVLRAARSSQSDSTLSLRVGRPSMLNWWIGSLSTTLPFGRWAG